tara:strand:- start:246 stop:536 length:291 start_codon:yes stop_codon:yes gene_type:complete
MCTGRPKTPKLPDPPPPDSAIEKTADRVVVGSNRTTLRNKRNRQLFSLAGSQRLGTRSLQIPLLINAALQASNYRMKRRGNKPMTQGNLSLPPKKF